MVFFNYALRKLNAKIVYYGPGLCGKTTNLQWIHDHFEGGQRGKMISLSTEGDRTIFFDLLPIDIGTIRGMDVTLQLYTVPGQVHYNSTRQLVLRGADGVVFVADSQSTMRASNVESLRNLEENLSLQGVELDDFPHVLQFNKRDLGDLISVEDLDGDLNQHSVPFFEAIATDGVGVQETLEGIVKLVMRSLRERYEPMAAVGLGGAGVGPTPLDVEVPVVPPRPPAPAPAMPPSAPPIGPRPPLAPPRPASRPTAGADGFGLEDDVPTRVYAGGRPPAEEDLETRLPAGGFWDRVEDGRTDAAAAGSTPPAEEIDDFGFTMPFADIESTTDVTGMSEPEPLAVEEPPLGGFGGELVVEEGAREEWLDEPLEPAAAPAEGSIEPTDEPEAPADDELPTGVASPFDVGGLTPEPYGAGGVFGAPVPEEPQMEVEEPGVVPEPERWGVSETEEVAAEELPTPAVETIKDAPRSEEPSEVAERPEKPASWPARLRGTVDDLVASVLGTRSRGGDQETLDEPAAPAPEPEPELELTAPEAAPIEPELEPAPDMAERAWWQTPLDEAAEPAEEEVVAYAEELADAAPAEPSAEVEQGAAAAEVEADQYQPWRAGEDESHRDDGWAEPGAGRSEGWELDAGEEAAAEPAGALDETGVWPADQEPDVPAAEDDAHEPAWPSEPAIADSFIEAVSSGGEEPFVPEDSVDVEPPPVGDRDWHEAHTGEVLPGDEQPAVASFDAAERWAGSEPWTDAEPVDDTAAREPFADEEAAPVEGPFAAAQAAGARPAPSRPYGPITLGEGDPFGDVVDDEQTPVRQEVRPEIVVAAPAVDSLVRAGDNQLHVRLHGTGAIAESGQVRALDIEVPVPGSWVGNRRVTLQLRLTLSPVPEDDDGGPGGAP